MTDMVLQERMVGGQDWATLVFLFALLMVALAKSTFEGRFADFSRLIISDKYNKIYKDGSHLMSWFNICLFAVQIISFTFFIQLILSYNQSDKLAVYLVKTDWILFIKIATLLTILILSKYLIEKIIATSFKVEEFAIQFNLQKVNYRSYIALLLLPVTIVLFYSDNLPIMVIYILVVIILAANLLTYLNSLKIYQNFIIPKLFYFILYLCTLEIAPYYFIYYWFAKR